MAWDGSIYFWTGIEDVKKSFQGTSSCKLGVLFYYFILGSFTHFNTIKLTAMLHSGFELVLELLSNPKGRCLEWARELRCMI